MKTTRRFRVFTVILSLWTLLFAQGVLAGYLCEGKPAAAQAVTAAIDSMPDGSAALAGHAPCSEDMSAAGETQDLSKCAAHCQHGSQSADSYQPAPLASAEQLGAVLTVHVAELALGELQLRPEAELQRRRAAAPLSIQHCCFRI